MIYMFAEVKASKYGDFPGGSSGSNIAFHHGGQGGACSVLAQGTKIPHALQPKTQNIKQKQYCNKFSKDVKNGPRQKKVLKNLDKLIDKIHNFNFYCSD